MGSCNQDSAASTGNEYQPPFPRLWNDQFPEAAVVGVAANC